MRTSYPQPSLLGGVSQQPRNLRLDSQGKEMLNGWATPVDGLTKRWAAKHISTVHGSGTGGSPFAHLINRDATERYLVQVRNKDLTVHGVNGTSYPVYGPSGAAFDGSYLDFHAATADLLTDGDYFTKIIDGGAWADGGGFLPGAPPNPLTLSSVYTPYGTLAPEYESDAGWATPDAFQTQNVGVFGVADLRQVLSCWVNTADFVGDLPDSFSLDIRDTSSALNWTVTYDISGDYAYATGARATGGVSERVGNWIRIWVGCQNESAPAAADGPVVGNARQVRVRLTTSGGCDEDGVLAYGAMLEEGVDEPSPWLPDSYHKMVQALTIADYTFILNRRQTVGMTANTSPEHSGGTGAEYGEALIFAKAALYCTKYHIHLDTTHGSSPFDATVYTTGLREGGTAGSGSSSPVVCGGIRADTTAIINNLFTHTLGPYGLSATAFTGTTTTHVHVDPDPVDTSTGGPVGLIRGAAGDVLTRVEAWSSGPTDSIVAVFDRVDSLSDLPLIGVHGFIVQVAGDPGSGADDYYVKFEGEDSSYTGLQEGAWEETLAPGIAYELDGDTMPHQLTRQQDDAAGTVTGTPYAIYFEFGPASWGDRLVGDLETSPNPSFVGDEIEDIFFHANRLGFISGSSVQLSEAGSFFNFFRTTTSGGLIDSDPIDISASTTDVVSFKHAVNFDREVFLFSDRTQFVLSYEDQLTPKTARLVPVFNYETYTEAAPLAIGNGILFPFKRGDFSGVREILKVDDLRYDSVDISAQCPAYISGVVQEIVGSPLEDIAIVRALGDKRSLWVYKWFWDGQRKAISAWSKWTFDADVEFIGFIDNDLYLVLQRTDAMYLEKMDVSNQLRDTGLDWQVRLDRRVDSTSVTTVYDPATDISTFTLPYSTTVPLVFVDKDGADHTLSGTGDTYTLTGNYEDESFWIGIKFDFRWVYHEPGFRGQSGEELIPTDATVQLRYCNVQLADSNHLQATVAPQGKAAQDYEWNAQAVVDEVALLDADFRFPIDARSRFVTVTLESDSFLPFSVIGTEWEATLSSRSTRFTG